LKYFREKRDTLGELIKEYESKYGALTIDSALAEERWEWVATPFPWERGES
jgi:spore coat protein JB